MLVKIIKSKNVFLPPPSKWHQKLTRKLSLILHLALKLMTKFNHLPFPQRDTWGWMKHPLPLLALVFNTGLMLFRLHWENLEEIKWCKLFILFYIFTFLKKPNICFLYIDNIFFPLKELDVSFDDEDTEEYRLNDLDSSD